MTAPPESHGQVPRHSSGKVLAMAIGLPLATWFGIDAYWSFLRWCGEVPLYYVAAMVGLRGLLTAPLQVLVVGMLAVMARRELARLPWWSLGVAAVLAALLAIAGDAIGMRYSHRADPATAGAFWQFAPHLIGPLVLIAAACLAPTR